jgi:hypothetical protein
MAILMPDERAGCCTPSASQADWNRSGTKRRAATCARTWDSAVCSEQLELARACCRLGPARRTELTMSRATTNSAAICRFVTLPASSRSLRWCRAGVSRSDRSLTMGRIAVSTRSTFVQFQCGVTELSRRA